MNNVIEKLPLIALVCALAACGGGGEEETGSGSGSGSGSGGGTGSGGGSTTTSSYLLGELGGFIFDNGGPGVELTSVSDFDTIGALAAAVHAARNASTFTAQLYTAWTTTFPGTFSSSTNWSYGAINLEYARGAGLTGSGQTIAVYDSGFRVSHTEFSEDGRTVTNVNDTDTDYHGTGVASIAAGSDGFGVIEGVAPNANLRLFGWSSLSGLPTSWEASIQDAADHNVIAHTNSWALSSIGGATEGISSNGLALFNSSFPEPGFQDDLINFTENGVVVFAVDNDETATESAYMAALPVLIPELEQGWLAVTNLFVPYNTVTDSFGTPERLSAACLEAARWCLGTDGSVVFAGDANDTDYLVGTGASFAVPQVSGALALLAEAFPTLSAPELRNRLLATADNSFFAHTDELVFEGGYAHGYNSEFGHGLMDLRAALLPIGSMTTLAANGAPLVVGEASVVGGGATGDTLMQGLSEISVLSTDQMNGDFKVAASAFAAQNRSVNPHLKSVLQTSVANLSDERKFVQMRAGMASGTHASGLSGNFAAFDQATLIDSYDGSKFSLFEGEKSQLNLLVSEGETGVFGIEASIFQELGASTVKLGFSTIRDSGSAFGIASTGNNGSFQSMTAGMDLAVSVPIGRQSSLNFSGEYGVADSEASGLISGVERLSYSSFGLSVDRSNLFSRNDAISFYVKRPVKVVGGSAYVDAAVGKTTLGELIYETHEIALSPDAHQMDIGFDYHRPLFDRAELHLGVRHSTNYGHVSGDDVTSGLVRIQWTF